MGHLEIKGGNGMIGGMEKSDFKFNPMWAFEKDYLKTQANLPEEERDWPRKKFDFSGEYGVASTGATDAIRAEDLSIVRELLDAYAWPTTGKVFSYGEGWDPYYNPYGGTGYFRPDRAEMRIKGTDIFRADKSYEVPNPYFGTRTVIAADEYGEPGDEYYDIIGANNGTHFRGYYEWRPGLWGDVERELGNEKPGDDLIVTVLVAANLGDADVAVDRRALEDLLFKAEQSCVSSDYSPDEEESYAKYDYLDHSIPTAKAAFSTKIKTLRGNGFPYPLDDNYRHGYRLMKTLSDAAKAFRILDTNTYKSLWNSLKIVDSKHPKVSRGVLDTLYDALNGLEFTRRFALEFDSDPDMVDSDDWYERTYFGRGGIIGARWLPGSSWRTYAYEFPPEECGDEDPPSYPRTCTQELPHRKDGEHTDGPPYGMNGSILNTYNSYQTTSITYYNDGTPTECNSWAFYEYLSGESIGTLEISTVAGIPKTISVTSASLVLSGQTSYMYKIQSGDNGFPTWVEGSEASGDVTIPVRFNMEKLENGAWSGKITAATIKAAIGDHMQGMTGYSGFWSYEIIGVEISFKVSVP